MPGRAHHRGGKGRRTRMLRKSDSMLQSSARNTASLVDLEARFGAQVENAMNIEMTDIDLETERGHLCHQPLPRSVASAGPHSATAKPLCAHRLQCTARFADRNSP